MILIINLSTKFSTPQTVSQPLGEDERRFQKALGVLSKTSNRFS